VPALQGDLGAQGEGDMNQKATAAEARYMGTVASMRCLICRRFPDIATNLPTEVHHLGEGSSRQNNWLVVPLCGSKSDGGHHRAPDYGLHGMGSKAFVMLYHVPHGTEYGLLAWLNEDMHEALHGRKKAAA
jgi:hypothetical protein